MANPSSNIDISKIDNDFVEDLKTELSNLKIALEDIKKNNSLDEEKKKEETKNLNNKIEELSKKIEESIKVLEDSIKDPNNTDQTQKDTREKYKKDLEKLQTETVKEITELRDSILKSGEKGTFGKLWDWTKEKSSDLWNRVGEQWEDVRDGEKWKNEKGKNILRTAGFVATGIGAISLIYKGMKNLFSGDNDSEEDEGNEEESSGSTGSGSKKKESLWERGLNFLIDKLTSKK